MSNLKSTTKKTAAKSNYVCGTCSCGCEKNACRCQEQNCQCGCSKPGTGR